MKKKFISYISLFMVAVIISGCGSSGNTKFSRAMSSNQYLDQLLIDGKTTQAQVRQALGDPIKVDFDYHHTEKWYYKHTRKVSKVTNFVPLINNLYSGTDNRTRKLIILFDENKIVKRHTITDSKGEDTMGVFG